jgi:cytochrome c oxidase subunit 1
MTWLKLPLFAWATFFVAIIQLVATPVLAAAVTMILLDRNFGNDVFGPPPEFTIFQ